MFRKIMFGVLFFALLWLLVMPVAAQEVTDDPGSTVVVVTDQPPLEEATPITEPPPVVVIDGSRGILGSLGSHLIAVLAGIGIGASAVSVFATRLKNDKPALDAIEWLGRSIPVEALTEIRRIGEAFRNAGEVIDIVTDGQPNLPPDPLSAASPPGHTRL